MRDTVFLVDVEDMGWKSQEDLSRMDFVAFLFRELFQSIWTLVTNIGKH